MTNWHHDNPIMTSRIPAEANEVYARLTGNGTSGRLRFDLRVDSEGGLWTTPASDYDTPAGKWREGTISYSDTGREFDLYRGKVDEYGRNYFGALVHFGED